MHLQIQQPIWSQLRAGGEDAVSFLSKAVSSSFQRNASREEPTHCPLSIILLSLCRFFTISFVTAHWAHVKVHSGVFKFSFGLHLWKPYSRANSFLALLTIYSECSLQSGIETAFPLWRLYAVGWLLELQQHGHLCSRGGHRKRVNHTDCMLFIDLILPNG